jgi:DNA-binding NarL/FixJ family response regulator
LEKRATLRILVADDHESVRKGVCVILGTRGDIEVCGEAVNGQEAIDKAQELKPDLIILDITMPVLNGIDAAEILRKKNAACADPVFVHASEQADYYRSQKNWCAGLRQKVRRSRDPFERGRRSSAQRAVFPLRLFKNSAWFGLQPPLLRSLSFFLRA